MEEPILKLENVWKSFTLKGSKKIHALQGISLEVQRGEILGIVGESGCGKSTLARVIMGAYSGVKGKIYFEGKPLVLKTRQQRKDFAKNVQMIFQDPYTSLNPRMKVEDIVGENLVIQGGVNKDQIKAAVKELLNSVGLTGSFAGRFPGEFSGGQRQRIGIARALAVNPKLLICDEPISALDVSIQSQIMNLLKKIGEERELSYIFIAHDLGMVHYISSKIAVMYRGNIVELARADEIKLNPFHPYTKLLSQAVLMPDPNSKQNFTVSSELNQEITQGGCAFAPRCELKCKKCSTEKPQLKEISQGHFVACHKCLT